MKNKNVLIFLIVLSAVNLGINLVTIDIGGICGWLCALFSQIELLMLYQD
jgi:hypothetical protein